MPRQFVISGTALIKKVKISQQARAALQNIAISVDTRQVENSLDRLGLRIKTTLAPLTQLGKGSTSVNRLAGSFNQLNTSVGKANTSLKRTEGILLQVLRKASAFRVSTIIINNFFNALNNAITFTLKFDATMRDVNKILRLNDGELKNLSKGVIQTAADFNLAAEEIAKGTLTAAQAGLGGPGASQAEQTAATISLVRRSALLASTTSLDFAQAMETLLAVMNQTSSSIEQATVIVSKFSAVEDAAAIDASDLAEIFKRAGTTLAQSFGGNMNEAIGLFAALQERTRQSSSVIGTYAKTLGSRLGGANSEAVAGLKELGISLTDSSNRLKNIKQILEEVAEATQGLGAEDVGRIIGKIGGVRQAELFKAQLETVKSTATEQSRANQLAEEAAKGPATQLAKSTQEAAKFEAQINKIKQRFNDIVLSLKDGLIGDVLNSAVTLADKLLSIFESIGKKGSLGNILGIGAGLLGAGKLFETLTGGALGGFSAASQGKSLTPAQKQMERIQRRAAQEQELKKLNQGASRLQAGFNRLNHSLQPFSGRAIATGLALGVLGSALEEAAIKVKSDFLQSIGETIGVFGRFLPLGFKFAALATLFDVATRNLTNAFDSLEVIAGRGTAQQLAAAKFLENPPLGQGIADLEGARQIRQSIEASKFSGGITDENRPQAELLANRINALIGDAVQSVLQENQDAIAEGAELSKFRGDISNKISKFISEELDGVQFTQIQDLLKNKFFTTLIDEEFRGVLSGFATDASTVKDKFFEMAKASLALKSAMQEIPSAIDALTKEELERKLELLKITEQNTEAVINALAAEQQLFNIRSDSGILQELQTSIELEKQLSANRIKTLQEEIELVKNRELNKFQRTADEAGNKLLRLESAMKELSRTAGNNSGALDKLQAQYRQELAVREKNLQLLKEEKLNADVVAKINDNLAKIRQERIKLFIEETQAAEKELSASKQLHSERVSQATNIAIALNKELEAQEKLKSLLSSEKGGAATVDLQKEEVNATIMAGKLRLAELNQEIMFLDEIKSKSLENRKIRLQELLDIERTSLTGQSETDAPIIENIKRLETLIASVSKAQLKNGEETNKLVAKRAMLESELRTIQLDGAVKILEAEKRLADERIKAASQLLNIFKQMKGTAKEIFDSQKKLTDAIRGKIDEAAENIRSKRSDLSSAFSQLASAREALINAMRSSSDTFAEFNFALEKANNAADKVLGKFFGLRDQASSLDFALQDAISAAAMAGASEEKLAELRRNAAEEQLRLFEQLLSDTRSKAEAFFLSSAEDRQGFVEGLAAIQQIASQFSGNIENFRGLSQNDLNNFGRSLIALPQEVRRNIVSALDQLPDGVSIAGLSQDEIREIIAGASLGESESVGIERLSDTIQIVADLTRQVAELNTAQLVSQNKNLVQLQAGVAEAREQVLIAKNALVQAQLDAQRTQAAIGEVVSTLNSQIGESREVFKSETAHLIATIKDPAERQARLLELMVQFQKEIASKIGNTASLVGGVTPDSRVETIRTGLPSSVNAPGTFSREIIDTISKGIVEANKELKNEVAGLTTTISGNFVDNLNKNTSAIEQLAGELVKVSTNRLQDVKAELNIDNTQKINITGATEIVQSVMAALQKQDFVKQSDLLEIKRIIQRILEDQINAGITRPNRILGGG